MFEAEYVRKRKEQQDIGTRTICVRIVPLQITSCKTQLSQKIKVDKTGVVETFSSEYGVEFSMDINRSRLSFRWRAAA